MADAKGATQKDQLQPDRSTGLKPPVFCPSRYAFEQGQKGLNMDILYHYCSTTSFHAIAQSHSLWLSSLSLSNDTMEGKLVASTIARLAERDSLDQSSISRLQGEATGTVLSIYLLAKLDK